MTPQKYSERFACLGDLSTSSAPKVNAILASQSLAVMTRQNWRSAMMTTGAKAFETVASPGTEGFDDGDISDILDTSKRAARQAVSLACLGQIFASSDTTSQSAPTSFLYPCSGVGDHGRIEAELREAVGTTAAPSRRRTQYTPTEREIANLALQLGDTEATADLFISLTETLQDRLPTSGDDACAVSLASLPVVLGIAPPPGGIPETLILAAIIQAGQEPKLLANGKLGVLVASEAVQATGVETVETASGPASRGQVQVPNIAALMAAGSPLIHADVLPILRNAERMMDSLGNRFYAAEIYDRDMQAIAADSLSKVSPPAGSSLTFSAYLAKEVIDGTTIGDLAFQAAPRPLGKLMASALQMPEDVRDSLGVTAITRYLNHELHIAGTSSTSPTHSFAKAPFIPTATRLNTREVTHLARILAEGDARLLRSCAFFQQEQAIDWSECSLFNDTGLHSRDLDTKAILSDRRGSIGEPLVDFWCRMRQIGRLKNGVEAYESRSGPNIIPKLTIDGVLLHIVHKPLLEQIWEMFDADCRGLAWLSRERGYAGDENDPFADHSGGQSELTSRERMELRRSGNLRAYKRFDLVAIEFGNVDAALEALRNRPYW